MSLCNEITQQILSIKEHAHISHIEYFFTKTLGTSCTPVHSTSRQGALLNQALIEFFKIDLNADFEWFTTSIDSHAWPLLFMSLMSSKELITIFELWAACVYAEHINKYLAPKDIETLKRNFSQHYCWLTTSVLCDPGHPQNNLKPIILYMDLPNHSHSISANYFIKNHIAQTSFVGAEMISREWPSQARHLLLLKLAKPLRTPVKPTNRFPLNLSELEHSISHCLKRISPKWYAKFYPS